VPADKADVQSSASPSADLIAYAHHRVQQTTVIPTRVDSDSRIEFPVMGKSDSMP